MKGFTEIEISEKALETLEYLIKCADDFIEEHKITPKGKWETRKSWFGLVETKVWCPASIFYVPLGVSIIRGWYTKVYTNKSKIFEYRIKDNTKIYNTYVETNKIYDAWVALRDLATVGTGQILVDEELAKYAKELLTSLK